MEALADLNGTTWAGTSELWLDPLGDNVVQCDCTMSVDRNLVRYTWSYEGKAQKGSVTLRDDGAVFADSWHQPEPMACRHVPDAWGLFQVRGEFGPDSDWGWRIALVFRASTDELVLQMTNIAPWGEEARAVRITCQRQ